MADVVTMGRATEAQRKAWGLLAEGLGIEDIGVREGWNVAVIARAMVKSWRFYGGSRMVIAKMRLWRRLHGMPERWGPRYG